MCGTRVEVDEAVCPTCGLRWGTGERRPPCPNDKTVPEMEEELTALLEGLNASCSFASFERAKFLWQALRTHYARTS